MLERSNSPHLCLSPLTIEKDSLGDNLLMAGDWCLINDTVPILENSDISYQVYQPRILDKEQFCEEADLCMTLYDKYSECLAKELNRIHNIECSSRYWKTLLNGFLYIITASVIDHYMLLKSIADKHENVVADIIDPDESWVNPHLRLGGSSRILHLLIYSIIINKTGLFPSNIVEKNVVLKTLNELGDGKKDLSNKKKNSNLERIKSNIRALLYPIKRSLYGELPLSLFKFTGSDVLALGDQYLQPLSLKKILISAGVAPFYVYARKFNTSKFELCNKGMRDNIIMPNAETALETALQECIRRLLPTLYLENYSRVKKNILKIIPKKKLIILDSQHCNGGEHIEFYLAESVENYNSHHLMICHGGCYGAMEVSIQEKVWAQISDSYAMWSNSKDYGLPSISKKMPSLRFHDTQGYFKDKDCGDDILLFLTGYYPNRYAYNSIYPYTIDTEYDQWQVRFLNHISERYLNSFVIRDFHNSERISNSSFMKLAREKQLKVDSSSSLKTALINAKLSIQTVPQTTYLETISYDHPTICFWNPKANLIRDDLKPYYDNLVDAGMLHYSPESAADKINNIAGDPLRWWCSETVQNALTNFRENVCYTSMNATDIWADFIQDKR